MYERVTMLHTSRLAVALGSLAALVATPARADEPVVRIETLHRTGRAYRAALAGGGHAELTLDPRLQEAADDVLRSFQIPYGAAVVLSVPDGRVLALVGRSAADPTLGVEELALRPWAP